MDSTVLAYVMKTLNERDQYGLNLFLLSIDEGITGYLDRPSSGINNNTTCLSRSSPMTSYTGGQWIASSPRLEKKNNCTFCGVFRRQALDASLGVDHIVTGHNADDMAETVLTNSTYPLLYLILLHGADR